MSLVDRYGHAGPDDDDDDDDEWWESQEDIDTYNERVERQELENRKKLFEVLRAQQADEDYQRWKRQRMAAMTKFKSK